MVYKVISINISEPSFSIGTLKEKFPISMKNRDWERLTNIKKSIDGTTGIYFLFFDDEIRPRLCLKLSDNPYAEFMGTSMFREFNLRAPETELISTISNEYKAISSKIE